MLDPGYSIEKSVLTDNECQTLLDSLTPFMTNERRGGVRHLMSSCEPVQKMAKDERLTSRAEQYLGKPAIPFKATLFCKTGKANWLVSWHQDTALPLVRFDSGREWGPWSKKARVDFAIAPAWALERIVALRVQLDRSGAANGPLRLIEGSHKFGVLDADAIDDVVRGGRQIVAATDAGGIIAMSPLIVHAPSKATTAEPRRVLHIEYADALELSLGIQLASA